MRSEPPPSPLAPLLDRWTDFLKWLLQTTDTFPKKARFTLTSRIDNVGLDILDLLTTATYRRASVRTGALEDANLRLTRLRLLLRLAAELGYLSSARHAGALRTIDEIGRILGGWRRSQSAEMP